MINLFKINNKKQKQKVMDHLNETTDQIYYSEKERVLSKLENDLQKVIYLDWWYGGRLWKWDEENKDHERSERYKHVNEHDWEMARGYILETTSNGMG